MFIKKSIEKIIVLFSTVKKSRCLECNNVKKYSLALSKLHYCRKRINDLKHIKDNAVKDYIVNKADNQEIKLDCLNYRALLKHYRETFLKPRHIGISLYPNNNVTNLTRLNAFNSIFSTGFYCETKYEEFPHLIGIKFDRNTKNSAYEFIQNIHYEKNLIKDYHSHGVDLEKLECYSWIQKTIYSPNYICTSHAIKANKLKADLIFVRMICNNTTYYAHVVCMKKSDYTFKSQPVYAINSQFAKKHNVRLQFDLTKAIFQA